MVFNLLKKILRSVLGMNKQDEYDEEEVFPIDVEEADDEEEEQKE